MSKNPLLQAGMPVELIVSPGDIRCSFVENGSGERLSLAQTSPFLTADFIDQSILMTFKDESATSRIGYKVKVVQLDHDSVAPSFIEIELLDFIAEYDLRKYPRFNPNLFDNLRFSYGGTVLNLQDVSAGGARAACRTGSLAELTKGEIINLSVAIGNLNYTLKAEVMRFRRAIAKRGSDEIAVAFMEWDKHFLPSPK